MNLHDALFPHYFGVFSACQAITSLRLGDIPIQAHILFMEIAYLPALVHLRFMIDALDVDCLEALPSEHHFPCLKECYIWGQLFEAKYLSVINVVATDHLVSVQFYVDELLTCETLQDILERLLPCKVSLEEFVARWEWDWHPATAIRKWESLHHNSGIRRATLAPLLQFPNILTFRIDLLGPLEIDDTFHEQLGLSCPRMQQLDLVATAPKQWPSRVTFEGLAQLANLCANLNDVGMHIAISYPMTVAADNCRRNNNTTKLSVGCSWIGEYAIDITASLLSRLFPRLQKIITKGLLASREAGAGAEHATRNKWVKVMDRILTLHRERQL